MKYIIILVSFSLLLFGDNLGDASKIDIAKVKSYKVQNSMQKWLDGNFGLHTYKVNYLLPFGVANRSYQSNIPTVDYSKYEAELQVSLKLEVMHNKLGLGERYYLSYTHQAFWQVYTYSSPFRESLYNPEGFVIFPIQDSSSMFQLRSLKLALAHRSNGQPNTENIYFENNQSLGNLSKSINYVYATLRMQHQALVTDLEVWAPLPPVGDNLSDNPDLMDYVGYSSITFTYFSGENMFTLMGRGNIATGKGAMEFTYSHPHPLNSSTYWYVKFFSGYCESLIDYNKYITKFSIGFSFSR